MSQRFKALFILMLLCITNSLASEQPKRYPDNNSNSNGKLISVFGGASGVVASDDITINCLLVAEAFSARRAEFIYFRRFESLKEDLGKLGIRRVTSSEYSVKITGKSNEMEIYTASAKLQISANTLTQSTQASKRLEQLGYIKNQYSLYNYSKSKVNKKIEELLDTAIVKAEEKALEKAEQEGKFITSVYDSSIQVDAEARFLKYSSEEERQRYRGKKGYKYINLEVYIVYGVEEFEEYRRTLSNRGVRVAASLTKKESFKSHKETLSKFRSSVRSKLLAQAIKK